MLLTLTTKDFKVSPLAQTGLDNYFNNNYTNKYNTALASRVLDENVRGHSEKLISEAYHILAYALARTIYVQVHQIRVNTTYAYYDAIYDFDRVREILDCHGISLNHVFASFGLFTDEIIAPSDVLDGIYYPDPTEGAGTLIRHTMPALNLAKGNNLINHNKSGEVVGLTLFLSNGYSQTAGWSIDHSLITDSNNQVVVYASAAFTNCRLELIIDIS